MFELILMEVVENLYTGNCCDQDTVSSHRWSIMIMIAMNMDHFTIGEVGELILMEVVENSPTGNHHDHVTVSSNGKVHHDLNSLKTSTTRTCRGACDLYRKKLLTIQFYLYHENNF